MTCNKKLTKRDQKKFCSWSCAAKHNNKQYPKRRKEKASWPQCRACGSVAKSRRGVHCQACLDKKKHYKGLGPVEEQTIKVAARRGGANRFDSIRNNARNLYKKELAKPCCEKCGYKKHVELCHVKPISDFEENTLVKVVNARTNILFLCPNCHWEFDHSL